MREGGHDLVITAALLDQLTRVLRYPRLEPIAGHPDLAVVLEWLYRPEHLVMPTERITEIRDDPADNLVLEAAVAGRADAMVSGDAHLLRLQASRGILVLPARAFVARFLRS